MSHLALTAKYRPQSFAELAGQDMLSSILSRASSENRVAPAYLFSGTRGVGKTTVARIFAKALNCETAPTAEPCNQCEQCRKITQGLAVDVVEIDGASNRGIDDIRKLKESVGYAPMEGRYKVFIIDEAHMLSREAFNALLKTLEEPPARVTFILATTEPHKFPATILSRCQHYVFKRLSNKALEAHLQSVLQRESVNFEAGAVRLVAERGAGSVRDSMSLLGQVLALGSAELTESGVRSVLGLAGQEVFLNLLSAIQAEDCPAILNIVNDLLDQGLDLGFFLRELGSIWRNLFILRQSGQAALEVLGLAGEEGKTWLEMAGRFSPAHIHASWQMILDGQRRVLNSLEPALSLEHLLLNLALLSRLLPLEQHGAGGQTGGNVSGQATRQPVAQQSMQPAAQSSPPPSQNSAQNLSSNPPWEPASPAPSGPGNSGNSMGAQGQQNTRADQAGEEKKNYSIAGNALGSPGRSQLSGQYSSPGNLQQDNFQRKNSSQDWQDEAPFPEAPDNFAYAGGSNPASRAAYLSATSHPSQRETMGSRMTSGAVNSASENIAPDLPGDMAGDFDGDVSDGLPDSWPDDAPGNVSGNAFGNGYAAPTAVSGAAQLDWEAFLRYSQAQPDLPHSFIPCLRICDGTWNSKDTRDSHPAEPGKAASSPELTVSSESAFNYERLSDKEFKALLTSLVKQFAGDEASLKLTLVESTQLSPSEIKQRFEEHDGVKALREEFQARLVDWGTTKTRR